MWVLFAGLTFFFASALPIGARAVDLLLTSGLIGGPLSPAVATAAIYVAAAVTAFAFMQAASLSQRLPARVPGTMLITAGVTLIGLSWLMSSSLSFGGMSPKWLIFAGNVCLVVGVLQALLAVAPRDGVADASRTGEASVGLVLLFVGLTFFFAITVPLGAAAIEALRQAGVITGAVSPATVVFMVYACAVIIALLFMGAAGLSKRLPRLVPGTALMAVGAALLAVYWFVYLGASKVEGGGVAFFARAYYGPLFIIPGTILVVAGVFRTLIAAAPRRS